MRVNLVLGLIFALPIAIHAATPQNTGPHGGQVVEKGPYQFEVNLNQLSHQVDVYQLKKTSQPPRGFAITIYNNKQAPQQINLSPLPPPAGAFTPYPHYGGQLALSQGDYSGFELDFDIPEVGPQSIRSGAPPG